MVLAKIRDSEEERGRETVEMHQEEVTLGGVRIWYLIDAAFGLLKGIATNL